MRCTSFFVFCVSALALLAAAEQPLHGTVAPVAGSAVTGYRVSLGAHDVEDPAAKDGVLAELTLGADGAFSLQPPAIGKQFYILVRDTEGHPCWGRSHCDPGTDLGTIQLGAAGALTGSVVDAAGTPAEDICLRIDLRHDNECDHFTLGTTVRSATDGSFTVAGLTAGTWRVSIDDPEWAPQPQEIAVQAAASTAVHVTLKPAARVAGRVVGPDGAPVPQAVITIGPRSATTAADGTFVMAGLAEGDASFSVKASGLALSSDQDRDVVLSAGATTTLDLTLIATGGLELHVSCAPGNVLPEAIHVTLNPGPQPNIYRDAQLVAGASTLSDLPPGSYDVTVEAVGCGEGHGKVEIVESAIATMDVVLPRVFQLTGSVRAPDGTVPVSVAIEATSTRRWDNSSMTSPLVTSVDHDGMITIADVATGSVVLTVRAPGYIPQRLHLEIAAQQPDPIACILKPGEIRRAQVRDELGAPVAGAEVVVELEEGLQVTGTSNAEGIVTLDSLFAGTWEFTATHQDFLEAKGDLPTDATKPGEVVLKRGLEISGILFDAEGQPLAGQQVSAWGRDMDGTRKECTTGTDGGFTLRGLQEGTYQISAYHDEARASREITAGTMGFELRLPQMLAVVFRVLHADGSPVVKGRMSLHAGEQEYESATTDQRGEARLKLTLAQWKITVTETGGLPLKRTVLVDALSAAQPIELRVESGLTLTCHVVGERPEGLQVYLRSFDAELPKEQRELQKLSPDGTLELAGLPAGRVQINACLGDKGEVTLLSTWRLLSAASSAPFTLSLPPLGRLQGELPAGIDVTAVRSLRLHGMESSYASVVARKFSFPALPVGTYRITTGGRNEQVVVGSAAVTAGGEASVIWEPRGSTSDWTASLVPPVGISGLGVVSAIPDGPLARCEFFVRQRSLLHTESDDRGRFTLLGLRPGAWLVQADIGAEDRTMLARQYQRIDVGEQALPERLHIRSSELRGRVYDASGIPLEKAWISLQGQSDDPARDAMLGFWITSNADGRFAVAGLEDVTYTVTSCLSGRGGVVVERAGSASGELELRLLPECTLRIRADVPAGLAPAAVAISGARIVIARWVDGELVWDGDERLFTGAWDIHVWAQTCEVRSLHLDLDGDRVETLALQPSGGVRVELEVPAGTSLLGRRVIVIDADGEPSPRPYWATFANQLGRCLINPTEFDGTTEIDGLAPGVYQLECSGAIATVTIEAGVTLVLRMRTAY